jgi:hypothetical protein
VGVDIDETRKDEFTRPVDRPIRFAFITMSDKDDPAAFKNNVSLLQIDMLCPSNAMTLPPRPCFHSRACSLF